ncbi:hypothetical protein OG331_27585 [Streptomyces sp. NBC_01017]|nr:hypothetical protein OG331_27585 [Streptomyces sp. NBC_01017]
MDINTSALPIAQDEARGKVTLRNGKAQAPQGLDRILSLVDLQDQIDILVWTGLLAEESIDSPAAIPEPHLHTLPLKSPDHSQRVRSIHHYHASIAINPTDTPRFTWSTL